MNKIHHLITTITRDVIRAECPEGLAEEFIRAEGDKEMRERPYVLVRCLEGEMTHPRLMRAKLILELHVRADEETAGEASTLHQEVVEVLGDGLADLHDELLAVGMHLRKFIPVEFTDENEEDRGRVLSQSWTVSVERVAVPEPTP